MVIAIDEVDRAIIAVLQVNADESNKSIAAKIGMSDVGVANRIKRLLEKNVIRPTVFYDTEAIGLKLFCVLEINVRGRMAIDVAADLSKLDALQVVVRLIGSSDLAVMFFAHDHEHVETVRQEVTNVQGVSSISVIVSTDIAKFQTSYGAYGMLQHASDI